MIKQNTYGRQNRKNTIPDALITNLGKEIKEERIQKRGVSVRDRKIEQQLKNRVNFATHKTGTPHTNTRL